jgi:hypothetical protein
VDGQLVTGYKLSLLLPPFVFLRVRSDTLYGGMVNVRFVYIFWPRFFFYNSCCQSRLIDLTLIAVLLYN